MSWGFCSGQNEVASNAYEGIRGIYGRPYFRACFAFLKENMKIAYVDYNALSTLALTPTKADKRYQDCRSMQDLWKAFRAGRVRFVTSKQDIETDILLRLNGQGCCITDVLRAKEAVEEFENWGLSDKERTKQWKRVLFFGEQIEVLPQRFEDSSGPGAEK